MFRPLSPGHYLWPEDGLVIEAETCCHLVTLNKINIRNTSCVLTCESSSLFVTLDSVDGTWWSQVTYFLDSVEIPTRCSFVIEFIIPKFIEGSTRLERHTAHHQDLQTVFVASGIYTLVATGRFQGLAERPVTTWVYEPEVANTVYSSWWWAVCRSKHVEPSINFGIINSITKLHLVGISTESSMMHGSMNIKFIFWTCKK